MVIHYHGLSHLIFVDSAIFIIERELQKLQNYEFISLENSYRFFFETSEFMYGSRPTRF